MGKVVVFPLSNLSAEKSAHFDKLLEASFEETKISPERKQKREALERSRQAEKGADHDTSWYQAWVRRTVRSKYDPNVCQKDGHR